MQSVVTLEVKPWDDETDMAALETSVRSIKQDGLVWGSSKFVAVGYGIKKLQITLVIEDELVSLDELQDKIAEFEEYVQSSDVAAMQSEFHPYEYEPARYTEITDLYQSCKHARLMNTRTVSGGYGFLHRCNNRDVNTLISEFHRCMDLACGVASTCPSMAIDLGVLTAWVWRTLVTLNTGSSGHP